MDLNFQKVAIFYFCDEIILLNPGVSEGIKSDEALKKKNENVHKDNSQKMKTGLEKSLLFFAGSHCVALDSLELAL